MNKKEHENKSKVIVSVLGLVLLVVLVVGITYAVFSYTKKGNVENTIRTGKITMSYTEGENGITLENAYPMQDSVGKVLSDTNQMFDFTVNINLYGSKVPVSYEVTAEKDENSTLQDNDVRIYLEKSEDGTNYSAVSEPSGYVPLGTTDEFGAEDTEMLLDRGSTTDTVTFNYRLRMWVASTYQVSGEEKYFTLKVNVYGNDGVNVEVKGVELDKKSATMNLTESIQLNATTTPTSPSDKTITWTSSNEYVATVTSTGLVETKGIGNVVITATASNGKSASANIKVTSPCMESTTANACTPGTPISYKVNDSTTQNFYILKDNGSTLTLITQDNIVESTRWSTTDQNNTNADAAMAALAQATNKWEQTARMITKAEAEAVGCKYSSANSCPIWISNGHHWTSTTNSSNLSYAYMINGSSHTIVDGNITYASGLHAVIDINK